MDGWRDYYISMIVTLDIKLHHTCWTGKFSTVLHAYLSITLHNTTRYDYEVLNSASLLYLDRAVNHSAVMCRVVAADHTHQAV